jgi:hypothetical protein
MTTYEPTNESVADNYKGPERTSREPMHELFTNYQIGEEKDKDERSKEPMFSDSEDTE